MKIVINKFDGLLKTIDLRKIPSSYATKYINCQSYFLSLMSLRSSQKISANVEYFFIDTSGSIKILNKPIYLTNWFGQYFYVDDSGKIRDENGNIYDGIPRPTIEPSFAPTITRNDERTEYFTGDGSTKTFIVSDPPIKKYAIVVKINGSTVPTSDYQVEWNTGEITFNTAPASGDNIEIQYTTANKEVAYIQWLYTWYNSSKGLESSPSPPSKVVKTNIVARDGKIERVYKIYVPTPPTGVDKARIYRIGGNLTEWSLVGEIDLYQTSYFDDDVAEYEILGLLESTYNDPPPTGLKFLTEYNSMFFGAIGSRLYFSEVGQPHYWGNGFNWIDFPQEITGIAKVSTGLFIFTRNQTFLITGNSPDALSMRLVSNEIGCDDHFTIAYKDGSAIWYMAGKGIIESNGIGFNLVSYPFLGRVYYEAYRGVVADRCYYLLHKDGVLVYDFRKDPVFREIDEVWTWADSYQDKLFYSKDGYLYGAFEGYDYYDIHYKSGYILGDQPVRKEFHKVIIYGNGIGECSLYINDPDQPVITQKLNLKEDKAVIGIPMMKNKGMWIQIELKGKLEVYSMEIIYDILEEAG